MTFSFVILLRHVVFVQAIAVVIAFILPIHFSINKTEWAVAYADESEAITPELRPKLPKLDVGLAFGAFYNSDYPGSDESRLRTITLPYIIYRGEIVRNDNSGLRGIFVNNPSLEFNLSAGAAFPARSSENDARTGMPDLDWMGQIGPQLVLHLNKSKAVRWDLLVPIRWVFSTDLRSWDSRGALFNPEIRVRGGVPFDRYMFISFSAGPVWTTESLSDYIYEVPSNYAAAERPAYDAVAGYSGIESVLSVNRKLSDDFLIYLGVGKNFFAQSKNRKSPLLRDVENELYFIGLSWSLYKDGVEHDMQIKPTDGHK